MKEEVKELKRIYCKRCLHFYITWESNFPNGCKLFGVKSKQVPSNIVYKSTGNDCENFIEKDGHRVHPHK